MHFDNLSGIFKAAFIFENHNQFSAKKEVKNKVNLNKYTPTVGISTLKHMIAGQIYKDYKWKVTAENVAVTAGGKQALFESMFAILQEGDEVIIPTPGWVTYKYQIILNNAKPILAPLNKKFDLDIKEIQKNLQ